MLSTTVAGVEFPHAIMNAAGARDVTLEELETLGRSHSSAIVMKSCTLEPRAGNPEPRYAGLIEGSINSMGLPNLGYKEYLRFAPILKSQFRKPVIASVCGMSLEDNLTMFEAFNASPVDLIEFNPGSPNTIGKPTMGYDAEYLDKNLQRIATVCNKPMGIKLPPYFDFVHFEQIASVLRRHDVRYVSCINSIGNALVIDPEREQAVIKPKGGFGGLGGKYIKYTALANVRKFHELLPNVDIIGVGGISSGTDVFEFILAGASAVQIATTFVEEGPECFARIEQEFNEIMQRKGYESISAARGKLRPL